MATREPRSDSSGRPHIAARGGYPRAVSTAHEPNPYGYAGEGTMDDELEDTAESIAIPGDDLTTAVAEAVDEEEEKRERAPRPADRER